MSDIKSLVSFGALVNNLFVDGNISFANSIAETMFEAIKPIVFKDTSEEAKEKAFAAAEIKNQKVNQDKAEFLSEFEEALGCINPIVLVYTHKTNISSKLLSKFQSIFSLCKVTRKGEEKYTGLSHKEGATAIDFDGYNPTLVWLGILAKATFNLTIEQRVKFIELLFPGVCTVKGTIITRHGVEFDLAKGSVKTPTRNLTVAKLTNYGMVDEDYIVIEGLHGLFLFCLQALGGTEKQLETSINRAVGIFKSEHNYGMVPTEDEARHYVNENKIYTVSVGNAENKFPCFKLSGGTQDPYFIKWVLSRGVVATSDKQNIKYITFGDGAESLFIGLDSKSNSFNTINDVSKGNKVYNRPIMLNYECAEVENRVASNLAALLSSGKYSYTKGIMKRVVYTNSVLGFGSGVAAIHENCWFNFSIDKKQKTPVNYSILGQKYLSLSEVKQKSKQKRLQEVIGSKIEEAINKVYAPGETILKLVLDGVTHDLAINKEKVADVKVVKGGIKPNVLDPTSFDIVLEVKLVGSTQFVKTRRLATKFTTLPYKVTIEGVSEWDILLNNETVKGKAALLEMYCNAMGVDHFIDLRNCTLTNSVSGEVMDLKDPNNRFNIWKEANTFSRAIQMKINLSTWEQIKEFVAEEVKVVAVEKDYVVVEEVVEALVGNLVFDVEVSTAYEAVSVSSLTLESAAALTLQLPKLGNALMKEAMNKTTKYLSLSNAYSACTKDEAEEIEVTNDEDIDFFINSVFPKGLKGVNDRKLINLVAKAFPKGVVFYKGKDELFINFGTVSMFGGFGSNGGSVRETSAISKLLHILVYSDEYVTSDNLKAARYSFSRIVKQNVDSKNVLKKPTRTGELVYSKVRTSYHSMLNSVDGIPVIVLNKMDPVIKLLGLDPNKEGQYVGIFRTPMPFCGGVLVKITEDRSVVDVAHVLVCPFIWAELTEGDSDGDGIALLNFANYYITKEEVKQLNQSHMGLAGYKYIYNGNVPFAEFMSVDDKKGKKAFKNDFSSLISNTTINPHTGEKDCLLTQDIYGDIGVKVALHYKGAVGTSYGICSKLVFEAVDMGAKNGDVLLDTCVFAWRVLYEGQGLSGFSPLAKLVFDVLNAASIDVHNGDVVFEDQKADVIFKHDKKLHKQGGKVIKELLKDYDHLNVDVFDKLIESRTITRIIPKLEGFGKYSEYWENYNYNLDAIKYGLLRRMSQGDDRVENLLASVEEAMDDEPIIQNPLCIHFLDNAEDIEFTNYELGYLSITLAEFHSSLVNTKKQYMLNAVLNGDA